jgi:beta-lactamase class C
MPAIVKSVQRSRNDILRQRFASQLRTGRILNVILSQIAVAAVCLPAGTVHAAEPPAPVAAAVERAFRPLLQQHDVPGIAVAVTVDGRQYFFNYGVASRASKTPVTQNTLFEIGSVSKTFTATLASYAQVQGKLSLDDHPGKYIPALRNAPIDKATLLHLGTYTAGGLPLQFPDIANTDKSITGYFARWKTDAAPGTLRRYSNPSLGLFGHLTALAVKRDFADAMEGELLQKLALRDTHIRIPKASAANYAMGLSKLGKPMRVTPGAFGNEAYGIKSTAADMIRYVEANIRPEALDATTRRAIEGTHVGYFKVGDMVQGLGWEQYSYPVTLERLQAGNSDAIVMQPNPVTLLTPPQHPTQPTLFNKTGSTNGFGAYVAFVPTKNIGIVMLANRNFSTPARIAAAYAVLEELAKDSVR